MNRSETHNIRIVEYQGFKIALRSRSVDELILSKSYQQHRFFPRNFAFKGYETVIDLGAHIGVFALIAASACPLGKVFAIEACQENYDLLQKNLTLNGMENTFSSHLAIASKAGKVELILDEENWAHCIRDNITPEGPQPNQLVKAQTLAQYLNVHGIDSVDYLKMNVEGAEYEILLKSQNDTLRKVKQFNIEFHPSGRWNGQLLEQRLRQLGFITNIELCENDNQKGWLNAYQPHYKD